MLDFLARRAVPGVEEVVDGVYRRSFQGRVVDLRPDGDDLLSRAVFDLDRDMGPIAAHLGADPVIGHLVRAAPGTGVPGTVDPDEIAVRALLGQQVSVAGARTLTARLVAEYGEPLAEPRGGVTHSFPAMQALAAVDPERLPMPRSRARALVGLAAALASGDVDLRADPATARVALLALPGIGPWTVEYVAMRALRDPDAFPATDLGIRHALERLGASVEAAENWRPYRAYAVPHLWSVLGA
jgi:AraC family transcriptional regulator, regulatory protein of adaptative response / DNA-3-methyladenine glycosylase II